MADLKFLIGDQADLNDLAKADGQFIVAMNEDQDAINIYTDMKDDNNVIQRMPLDLSSKGDTLAYDALTGVLELKSGNNTLSTAVVQGGGTSIRLADVTGANISLTHNTATITWTDPDNVELDGITLAQWAGTRVIRKVGSAPADISDGTTVVDSITKNQYSSSGYQDTGLTYGTVYYYRFFPYTQDNLSTAGTSTNITPVREVIDNVPSQNGSLTYNGASQTASFNNYNTNKMTVSGNTGTNAGTYTATFTPKSDYQWSDGSTTGKTVSWIIGKAQIVKPTATTSTFTYDGTNKTIVLSPVPDSNLTTLTNNTKSAAGNYTATLVIDDKDNYEWASGGTTDATYLWTINKATLTIPTVKSNVILTYTGSEINALTASKFNDYDSTKMTISGYTATNAGNHTATFHLIDSDNYQWNGPTITDRDVVWNIAKATSSITKSKSSITLNASKLYDDVTITLSTGDGSLSVQSSDSSIASVALQSGSTYRISAESNGTTTIVASVTEGTNYLSASTSITVEVSLVGELNNTDWATISSVSTAGTASTYWDVGDCKEITLNGTVGTLSLSNQKESVYILGFNHNSSIEGTGITFGGFKTAVTNGIDVCLVDDTYNSNAGYSGAKKFQMNHWGTNSTPYNTNYGGWAACDMRYDILGSTNQAPTPYGSTKTTSATGKNPTSTCATSPVNNTLMAALPSALRSVMKPITKYTDNKGNSSNVAANVTTTIDYLPLLSEFEVQGTRSYANEYEKNNQVQYKYFENGNSKIKYRHDSTSSAARWWLRSPNYGNATGFCYVNTDGGANTGNSRSSYGVAPAFLV